MSNPLEIIKKNDSELFDSIMRNRELAFKEGVLSEKTKLLIGLAIDAVVHAENGVRSLAISAIEAGATKEEITEALRIAYFIGGVGSTFTAANGLQGILD